MQINDSGDASLNGTAGMRMINTSWQKSEIMNHFKFLHILAFVLSAALSAPAQSPPSVEIVADFLERFDPAQAKDTSSTAVRRPASAGNVKQNGLFEHPQSPARPARVDYQIALPAVRPNELLLLAFDIALADGVQFGKGEDGVRFAVEVDGRRVFSRDWRECRWESHGIDLTPQAGQRVRLAFLVEAKGNTTYDWATWGNPRLLHFGGSSWHPLKSGERNLAFPIRIGAIAFQASSGVRVRLNPGQSEKPLEWTATPSSGDGGESRWIAKDFQFRSTREVTLEVEPKDALTGVWLAPYPAQPKLLQVSATQAVINAGDSVTLRAEVKNQGRGQLVEGDASLRIQANSEFLPAQKLPALGPNESWQGEWTWKAPDKPGTYPLTAQLLRPQLADQKQASVNVYDATDSISSIQNEAVKLEFVRQAQGYAYARVFARESDGWKPVAVWRPLFHIISDTSDGEKSWEVRPSKAERLTKNGAAGAESIEFSETARDADGVTWQVKLKVTLAPDQPHAKLHHEWSAGQPRQVRALRGPNIYVGDGTTGDAKTWGLFPGLEYLYGAERSSNPRDFAPPLDDRRTPHPHKITVPLMAITVGPDSPSPPAQPERFYTPDSLKDRTAPPNLKSQISNLKSDFTVALSWNPFQRWDGEHIFPSTRFASPNFDEGMRNHRIGLFLPSVPDYVAENADRAAKPYALAAGKTLTLDAVLSVTPGPVTTALREWIQQAGGLPKTPPRPRSFQAELDVCRAGFLKTLWDVPTEKWRHCIGWAGSHAPGFAALLWLDAQLAATPEARTQSRERIELAVTNMLRDGGPGLFTSKANCHIMEWEFPFLYGHLPEALAGLERQIRQLIESQQPQGGWLYQPGNAEQADLGQTGDSVLGTCANRASTLLRYARITGDAAALQASEKALRFMESFRVPRGGQTWECPMYEPDILAAAYAIRAYHDAFRVTGDTRWLHDAVYWAETGVPFVYLWTLADRPMMLGSTIPVFGSTFYTHTWLAVPVQWCGLVYAYHILHLAKELEGRSLAPTDSPLPLGLNFSPADWRRLAELITVSALHQQFAEGERIGAYPDSIANFEKRNPAFINPEDILVNVLALQGHDPDVKTERLKTDRGEIIVSSGASIEHLATTDAGVNFQLRFFNGELSHALVAGRKPREILASGKRLAESSTPVRREPGWWWDEKGQRLYLAVRHDQPTVKVQIH